jgi:hypothetical protein
LKDFFPTQNKSVSESTDFFTLENNFLFNNPQIPASQEITIYNFFHSLANISISDNHEKTHEFQTISKKSDINNQ